MKRALAMGFAVSSFVPSLAAAQEAAPARNESEEVAEATGGSVAVSALLGYGFGTVHNQSDFYRASYGVRIGYTFATPVYLGFTLVRYQGPESPAQEVDAFGADVEIGYDFSAGPFTLRPHLGLGVLCPIYSSSGAADGGSAIIPRVVPGLLAIYPVGVVTLGAEARYAAAQAQATGGALLLLGSVGVAF